MRKEVFHLWHLLQKRDRLIEDACSLGSPGFEPRYGSSYCTGAGFEDKVIAAVDMDEQIEETVQEIVQGMEADDAALREYTGQTQRVLRLRYLCGKGEREIASLLGISVRTVDRRLSDQQCLDDGSIVYAPIDILIEEHIVKSYLDLERVAAYPIPIAAVHKARAECLRQKYNKWLAGLDSQVQQVYESRQSGATWDEIAKGVGLSERQARRLYREATEAYRSPQG